MKEVILKIPDQKYDFFMDLVRQLGLEVSGETEINDAHKEIVRERIKTEKTGNTISWEKARKQFVFDDH